VIAALAVIAVSGCGGGDGDGLEPGETVELESVSGQILVKQPDEDTFATLEDATEVSVGTEVDASKGTVRLTSATADDGTQSGEFSEGAFEVAQEPGSTAVTLTLTGGDFAPCKTEEAKRDQSTVGGPEIRKLFADAEGEFRTEGQFAAAAVRGTKFRTVDACFGTLTDVEEGAVTVTDLTKDQEVILAQGEDYWAAKRP
jgi:hypothetical protein